MSDGTLRALAAQDGLVGIIGASVAIGRGYRDWLAAHPDQAAADAAPVVLTPDDWAAHVRHVIDNVSPDHVGIGLDLVGGRNCVPADASDYPDLIAGLERMAAAENVDKVAGQNWLRVLDAVGQGSSAANGRPRLASS